jgi:hypothetical protein
VRDQVSHPYKTTGKIIVSYILTFTFLDVRKNILNSLFAFIPKIYSTLNFFMNAILIFFCYNVKC